MPINTFETCGYDEETHSYNRNFNNIGRMNLFVWEEGLFHRVKAQISHRCIGCDNTIAKGCYCYGRLYWARRICLNCYEKVVNNFISSLKEHQKMAKLSLKDFKDNRERLTKNNVINTIAG